jgi:endoglucanase
MGESKQRTFKGSRCAALAITALALTGCSSGSEPRGAAAGSGDAPAGEGSAQTQAPGEPVATATAGSGGTPASDSTTVPALQPSGSAATAAGSTPIQPLPPGNPFAAMPLYVYPGTWAAKATEMLRATSPEEAALAQKIAEQPAAEWFSYSYGEIAAQVDSYVSAAASVGALPVLVPYHVPNRDCGLYSAGGAQDPQEYREWVAAFVAAIGERPAVVVIEPDSIPLLDTCLSEADQTLRLELLRAFAQALSALPSTVVYLDAGHSSWVPANIMAERLRAAGIAEVRGFTLNVSNYQSDADLVRYGHELIALLGPETHFVIDSSRNGNGPATGADSWCNPVGRALGRAPTADTGDPALDAYLWVKRPGESDGQCLGGPAPGLWFPERAYELARNATW